MTPSTPPLLLAAAPISANPKTITTTKTAMQTAR